MEDIKKEPKTYTQEDVDNITNKVREKYETKYVSKEEFDNLQKQLKEQELLMKHNELKNEFLKSGGIESAFNDFLESNKALLSSNNISEELNKVKESKQYFFKTPEVIPNEQELIKGLLEDDYKDNWNYLKVKVNKS